MRILFKISALRLVCGFIVCQLCQSDKIFNNKYDKASQKREQVCLKELRKCFFFQLTWVFCRAICRYASIYFKVFSVPCK